MQTKRGFRAIKRGPRFPVRAIGFPYGGPFNCLIVAHSPGFNCIGPTGASKNTIGCKMITDRLKFFQNDLQAYRYRLE